MHIDYDLLYAEPLPESVEDPNLNPCKVMCVVQIQFLSLFFSYIPKLFRTLSQCDNRYCIPMPGQVSKTFQRIGSLAVITFDR